MIHKLEQKDFNKVSTLIKNTDYELSVKAVIEGYLEGEIYVDNLDIPLSTLIITPECKVVAGNANNKEFNNEIKQKLDFFDQVTCDDEEWEKNIHEIHNNIAIRKYKRRYYQLHKLEYTNFDENLEKQYKVEYVTVDNLNKIQYENSDKIRDWFNFNDINQFKDYTLGSYIRHNNIIVSMCLVDCIVRDKIEVGVFTDDRYTNKGLGAIVTAATVSASIEHGITEIGWHCVDTNIGSIKVAEKVGFKKIKEYSSFTPFPPIENDTDLDAEGWAQWAQYYEDMNKVKPNYHWLAATCWAKAKEMKNTIANIKQLSDPNKVWFIKNGLERKEFLPFREDDEWKVFIEELSRDVKGRE